MWKPGIANAVVVVAAASVAACAVGPRYAVPQVAIPAAFKEQVELGGAVLQPADPRDQQPRDGWWEVFQDPKLNELQARMLGGSPQLAEGEARVRQARALVAQERAGYFPVVSGAVSATRSHVVTTSRTGIDAGAGGTFGVYEVNVPASWEVDLWGRVRRSVESATASLQAAAGDLASARLSLGAELAADYFQLRSLDAELALFEETIAAYERAATLTRNQYDAGIVSRVDVDQADTQLAAAQAQAVDLRLQRAQLEHAIAVLIGEPPATFGLEPLPIAGDPPAVPSDLPARVLERRPDVAAAERRVAAANAQIGVASSAFFPAVTLGGNAGFSAASLGQWLSWPMRFWSVGPAAAMTLFDAGARRAVKAQTIAAYDETVGVYRQTVLTAFQDVEDNLAAERYLAAESERQQAAVASAQRSVDITVNQYRAGTASYLEVTVQQETLLTNQRAAVSLEGRRFAAAVQLIRALGGGWGATPAAVIPAAINKT